MVRTIRSKAFAAVVLAAASVASIACNRTETAPPATATAPVPAPEPARINPNDWINFDTGANVKSMAIEGTSLWLGLPNGMIRYDTSTPDSHEIYTPVSTDGGLMSRGIYVIEVDRSGHKWIGSYGGGLTRFDGKSWTTYTTADGLGDQWIYDIVWDKHGQMWVATWKGVSVFDGKGHFKTYTEADGLADKWVYSIALDADGVFWFGTEAGVSRFDGRTWNTLTHADGLGADVGPGAGAAATAPVSALPSPGDADYGGEAPADQHHANTAKTNIGPNPNFVIASVVDRSGAKWFGTWGAGLSRFDGRHWKTFVKEDGLGGNYVHVLALDADGNVWAGTDGGASWFDGRRWRTLSERDGLLNDNVFSIVFDPQGRRWFGTWEGLSMYGGRLPT